MQVTAGLLEAMALVCDEVTLGGDFNVNLRTNAPKELDGLVTWDLPESGGSHLGGRPIDGIARVTRAAELEEL